MELVKVVKGKVVVQEDLLKQIENFEIETMKMKAKEDELKEELLKVMEENGLLGIELGNLKITYRKPSTRTALDTTRLKSEKPELYEEYSKTSEVKSSISISLK